MHAEDFGQRPINRQTAYRAPDPQGPVTPTVFKDKSTADCLFVLSETELNSYKGLIVKPDGSGDATEYAIANGMKVSKDTKMGYWWLRSVGTLNSASALYDKVAYAHEGSKLRVSAEQPAREDIGVRPAMRIDLS